MECHRPSYRADDSTQDSRPEGNWAWRQGLELSRSHSVKRGQNAYPSPPVNELFPIPQGNGKSTKCTGSIQMKPQPPFVWPEPRALENMCTYEHQPPFGELAFSSHSLFGIVSALTERGLDALECWLKGNVDLKVCLVVIVFPACATRQADLLRLLKTVERLGDKLFVHIHPLERITDRATNALCFLTPDSDVIHIVTGPSEDLGLDPRQKGQINFAFRADPAVTEAFKRYFDWLWANSRDITAKGAALT